MPPLDIKDNLKMDKSKEREYCISKKMNQDMKGILKKIKCMEEENIILKVEKFMKEDIKIINIMAKVL